MSHHLNVYIYKKTQIVQGIAPHSWPVRPGLALSFYRRLERKERLERLGLGIFLHSYHNSTIPDVTWERWWLSELRCQYLTYFIFGQEMQPTVRIVRLDISRHVRSTNSNKTSQYFSQKETNHFRHQLQTTRSVHASTATSDFIKYFLILMFSVLSRHYNGLCCVDVGKLGQ